MSTGLKAAVIKVEAIESTKPRLIDTEPERKERDRGVQYEWEVSSEPGEFGPKRELAVLSVGHSKDRKAFYATVASETEEHSKYGTTRGFILGKGVGLPQLPVARFSVKALNAYATQVLAFLRVLYDDPSSVGTDADRAEKVKVIFNDVPEFRSWVEVAEQPDDVSSLHFLQGLVDGNIESVDLGPSADGFVNDEGKYLFPNLPNPVATEFWFAKLDEAYGAENIIHGRDFVAGPLVIVGPVDDEGNTTSITDETLAEVQAFVAERQPVSA